MQLRIVAKYYIPLLLLTFIVCASLIVSDNDELEGKEIELTDNVRIYKLLSILGDEGPDHFPDTKEFGVSAKRGEALIKEGFSTKPGGGKTRQQSKHFVCTSCHNLEREDPNLAVVDPQARLEYTNEKGLPFLQGTTLYGAVNRESFYNDDYFKKYGDLVWPARNDIRGAIQLCAVECAQGRKLKKWEIESILAYLWSIDLKIEDLVLDEEETDFLEKAMNERVQQDSAIALVRSKYMDRSPAHFSTAYDSKVVCSDLNGNPDNGKLIYENSCLHCHAGRKFSFLQLDSDKLTFKHLDKKADGFGSHSLYQVARYGVYSRSGKRSYMPQYPLEKMSEQQLIDLKSYISQQAQQS